MGRRKIEIQPIIDDRNRSVTFLKRKNGLMKKAYELGVLCGAEVAVIVFAGNGKLYEFTSGDLNATLLRYSSYDGPPHEHRGPSDFEQAKPVLDQAPSAPPAEDDEDLSEEIDLDDNERKPKRESPAKTDPELPKLATTMSWASNLPSTASQQSWPYHHDAHSGTSASTSISTLNHLACHSPSPSLVSFSGGFPGSSEPSPRAMTFPHHHPTSCEGSNQIHTMTTAMPSIPNFNSDPTHNLHMSDPSANRRLSAHVRTPAPGPASAVASRFMMRHSPYISDEPSWQLRPSSALLPVSASSTGQTSASDGCDHRVGLTSGNLTIPTTNTSRRADSLGSVDYPLVTSNPFPRASPGNTVPTDTYRPEHRHLSSISYYRQQTEAEIHDDMGADLRESGGRPTSRVSESSAPAPRPHYVPYSRSGMAPECRPYASEPGGLTPAMGPFLHSYFGHRSMSLKTPEPSDHQFQWPTASTSAETPAPDHVTGMEWSSSPPHSHQLEPHP